MSVKPARRRSSQIVKLQRFVVTGSPLVTGTSYLTNVNNSYNYVSGGTVPIGSSCSNQTVALDTTTANTGTISPGFASPYFPNGFSGDSRASMRNAIVNDDDTANTPCVVPFPIKMFDTREGLFNDSNTVFNPVTSYGTNVPWAGVMSMIDLDIANLKKFLNGDWDANMPGGTPYFAATGQALRGSDIPQPTNTAPKAGGWVIYVTDRRGDYDFDGEYDMEDVYGANDGNLQLGEDVNKNTTLEADYTNEAPRYTGGYASISPNIAAVFDHKYYRRGVRLINAQSLPGIYDSVTPTLSRGFTVASENGVYVLGNYNATGIASVGSPTAHTDYMPSSNGAFDIPASIASDAVTILSNNWRDSTSFISPFDRGARLAGETTCRFAMLSGDTMTTLNGTPNQGGGDPKMAGGVHNFKRFLEDWGGVRLNYSGSLINLFNSHNNNAPFKCCDHVYSPPTRNWVFDATFLDTNRLPPGTPYFQYVQTTGLERTND